MPAARQIVPPAAAVRERGRYTEATIRSLHHNTSNQQSCHVLRTKVETCAATLNIRSVPLHAIQMAPQTLTLQESTARQTSRATSWFRYR